MPSLYEELSAKDFGQPSQARRLIRADMEKNEQRMATANYTSMAFGFIAVVLALTFRFLPDVVALVSGGVVLTAQVASIVVAGFYRNRLRENERDLAYLDLVPRT